MHMGISVTGFTSVPKEQLSQVDVRVILSKYRAELLENFDDIDVYEYVEYSLYDGSSGTGEIVDEDVDSLIGSLMYGYPCLYSGAETIEYAIPGAKDKRVFILIGGVSGGGDPPFEGFNELDMLIRACTYIPELGKELSVLGTGIILDGMNS